MQPETLNFGKMLIQLSNGASPPTFGQPCGFTSKGFEATKEVAERLVPDCDDPDAPAFIERVTRSLSAGISGSLVMAVGAYTTWRAAYLDTDPVEVRVFFNHGSLGYWLGYFHLTKLNHQGEQGDLITLEVEFQSSGDFGWVAA